MYNIQHVWKQLQTWYTIYGDLGVAAKNYLCSVFTLKYYILYMGITYYTDVCTSFILSFLLCLITTSKNKNVSHDSQVLTHSIFAPPELTWILKNKETDTAWVKTWDLKITLTLDSYLKYEEFEVRDG